MASGDAPSIPTTKAYASPSQDFSQYSVGKQFEGSLISSKKFGFFVDIGTGINALIPLSQISRRAAEKLQAIVESKSNEKILIELINVSAENKTISAKLVQDQIAIVPGPKFYNATVVSVHDFGIFARIDELDTDGLIPLSKLPTSVTKANIKSLYP